MKLIGASRTQIVNMYLATLFFYGGFSALVSIPLAMVTAQLLITELVQDLVNIIPDSLMIPVHIILIQVLVAFLLPLIAGLLPVIRGTRVTTQEALNDIGMKEDSRGSSFVERILVWFQKLSPLQRTYLLAIRNAIRHKGRLAQTLFVLIIGTALFISVLTVNNSVEATLDNFLNYHQYDVSVGMMRPYRTEKLESAALQIQGVEYVESWTIDSAMIQRLDDTESNHYRLYAVPVASELIDPQLINGRWLMEDDVNDIVINSDVFDKEPELMLGDFLTIEIGGYETSGKLVGVVRTDSQGPSIYMDLNDYANVTNTRGRATNVQIVANLEDQIELEQTLYRVFEAMGLEISEARTSSQLVQRNQLMFTLIISVLIIMALLLAGVGGLGLSTTMSINILERIREIGVLRAIGASNISVRWVVLLEGLFIGVLSWTIGTLLSIPISIIFSEQVGIALLKIPLNYHYSILGMVVWLFAVMFIAVAASLGPARNAERLTIREVLSYE
jgi:putative ABC transport system permease protein